MSAVKSEILPTWTLIIALGPTLIVIL